MMSIVQPQDLSENHLRQIIDLKNIFWPHTISSQYKWWREHSRLSDRYVLFFSGQVLLAFMRISIRSITICDTAQTSACFSEICVHPDYQNQSLGSSLIIHGLNYVREQDISLSLLLCSKHLADFYKKFEFEPLTFIPNFESFFPLSRHLNDSCFMVRVLHPPIIINNIQSVSGTYF